MLCQYDELIHIFFAVQRAKQCPQKKLLEAVSRDHIIRIKAGMLASPIGPTAMSLEAVSPFTLSLG